MRSAIALDLNQIDPRRVAAALDLIKGFFLMSIERRVRVGFVGEPALRRAGAGWQAPAT